MNNFIRCSSLMMLVIRGNVVNGDYGNVDCHDVAGYHWGIISHSKCLIKWTASRSERFLVAALRGYVRKAEQEERHLATERHGRNAIRARACERSRVHGSVEGKCDYYTRIALVIVKGSPYICI